MEYVIGSLLELVAQGLQCRVFQSVELYPLRLPQFFEGASQAGELFLNGKIAEPCRAGGDREHPDRRSHPERPDGLRHLDIAHDGRRGKRGQKSQGLLVVEQLPGPVPEIRGIQTQAEPEAPAGALRFMEPQTPESQDLARENRLEEGFTDFVGEGADLWRRALQIAVSL